MTAEQFRAFRHDLGLSQSGMAVALGITEARTIRRWEGGAPIPGTVALLVDLAKAYDDVRTEILARAFA